MKNIIIAILILTNVATLVVAHRHEKAIEQKAADDRANLVNELDRFYFGFCQDAKMHGYDKLDSFNRLCGE